MTSHQTYINEKPNAKTVVLMIHGILGTTRHFNFLIPYINKEYSIYNLLLKGHGSDALIFDICCLSFW